MASVYLTDEEWQALFNEPPDLLKLYLSIKRVMDYKTGTAGVSYRINDAFLREVLYIEAVQGRKAETVNRGAVRSKLARLQKLGLISGGGQHVFKCNYYDLPQSVQNNSSQPAARPAANQPPDLEPIKTPAEVILLHDSTKTPASKNPQQAPSTSANSRPPLTSKDRYIDKAQIHEFLKTVIDERSLLNQHNRHIMQEWVELKLKPEVLNQAIDLALQAKQGQGFGVAYLNPIVRQCIQKDGQPPPSTPQKMSFTERVEHLAAELKLTARPGETYEAFYQRLKDAEQKQQAN